MNKYVQDMTEIREIDSICTLSDILKLQDFVFSLIPYTESPFLEKIGLEKNETVKADLTDVYRGCKNNSIGGWCGLNAEFFRLLLATYGIRCWPYNYGLVNTQFTHVCIIIDLNGILFFMDPYFNRVYKYKDDFFVQYPDLIRLIQERKTDIITPFYGSGNKKVQTADGFVDKSGKDFEDTVFDYFYSIGLKNTLKSLFSDEDPKILMLIKIPDPPKK